MSRLCNTWSCYSIYKYVNIYLFIHQPVGAVSAFLCGRIRVNWEKYGELVLALCSLGQGAVLLIMSMAGSLMTSYVTYILFTIMYHTMITIAK